MFCSILIIKNRELNSQNRDILIKVLLVRFTNRFYAFGLWDTDSGSEKLGKRFFKPVPPLATGLKRLAVT